MTKNYKTGLVIGRFQPFHLGHMYLIERALTLCDNLVIGIGSPNIKNEDNPYTVDERMQFLEEMIEKEGLEKRITKIVLIPDVPDDEEWFLLAQKATGSIDVVIGDNEWVNKIYEQHGINVERIGYHRRDILEGKKIRYQMNTKKPWKERVPSYIASHLEKKSV